MNITRKRRTTQSLRLSLPPENMDAVQNELKTFAQGVDTDTYMTAAAMTFLSYDYLLTFADEVRLVWSSRLSFLKILFFLNRLLAFSVPILILFELRGKGSCKNLPRVVIYIDAAIFIISQLFLSMRVYAIWSFDKKVLASLALLSIPGFAGILYIAVVSTAQVTVLDVPNLFGTGCLTEVNTSQDWIIFTILLIQETSLLCLVLLRAFLVMKDFAGHILFGMYRVIVEDNIGYFLCVSLLSLANVCTLRFLKGPQASAFVIIHGVLQSIICARLFLRLRGAAYKQLETVDSLSRPSFLIPTVTDADDV